MTEQPAAHTRQPRTALLLMNLGTPDAPEAPAIRRYLREFLSDRRVVDLPRALWWPILNAFILPLRPRRLAKAYGSIWLEEGAPLLCHTRELASALAEKLSGELGEDLPVLWAMRYGKPSIASAMDQARALGVRRLLVLPLYPQYSATTTASAMDGLFNALRKERWMPEIRSIHAYHDAPSYIEALAQSVEAHWRDQGRGDHLMLSFHGIPQRYFMAGDPYYCHCHKTARLLAERLRLSAGEHSVCFQSRFGREPWLQPYTDERVRALAESGTGTLDVLCPGFAADCLETLEEVALGYRNDFLRAGGKALRYIPALNASPWHVDALAELCLPQLRDWLPQLPDLNALQARAAAIPAGTGTASPPPA